MLRIMNIFKIAGFTAIFNEVAKPDRFTGRLQSIDIVDRTSRQFVYHLNFPDFDPRAGVFSRVTKSKQTLQQF